MLTSDIPKFFAYFFSLLTLFQFGEMYGLLTIMFLSALNKSTKQAKHIKI